MRLFVPLTKPEFDALRDLAQRERRRPQEQAAVILARSLQDSPFASEASKEQAPNGALARRAEDAEPIR